MSFIINISNYTWWKTLAKVSTKGRFLTIFDLFFFFFVHFTTYILAPSGHFQTLLLFAPCTFKEKLKYSTDTSIQTLYWVEAALAAVTTSSHGGYDASSFAHLNVGNVQTFFPADPLKLDCEGGSDFLYSYVATTLLHLGIVFGRWQSDFWFSPKCDN